MEEIKQMDLESKDLVAERIEQMKELFPEIATEGDGSIDFEKLRLILGDEVDEGDERYAFTWPGKANAIRISQTVSSGTLRPLITESVCWDSSKNMYIKGDNLEVLKLLQRGYCNKISTIFIDPPYNTKCDRAYKDTFVDSIASYKKQTSSVFESNPELSGRYHSTWCSILYPRLKLARELLAPDGVIFVTLDDEENAQARFMLNEIFGESNFITEFIWEKKKKPSFLHRNIGKLFDYVLCYAKNAELTQAFSVEKTTEGKKYPFNNAGNGLATLVFPPHSVMFACGDGVYEAQDMSEGNIVTKLLNNVSVVNGQNANEMRLEGEWRYSQERLDEIVASGEKIVISKIPFRPNHIKPGGDVKKMKNVLSPVHYGCETNEDASKRIADLFGSPVFDTPKPVGLIELLIKAVTYDNKNAIIMDFYSGSATTAEAVIRINDSDEGNRSYILVQLPELCKASSPAFKAGYLDLCELGIDRIRKVLEERQNNMFSSDEGFRVFTLDESGIISPEPGQLLVDRIKSDRSDEDIIFEMMLKWGLELTYPIEKINVGSYECYSVAGDALICCMHEGLTVQALQAIADLEPDRVLMLDSILDDTLKLNAVQIFKRVEEKTQKKIDLRTV